MDATPNQPPIRPGAERGRPATAEGLVGRRAYRPPALRVLLTAEQLLEALGPAQANYGGTGMP